MVEAIQLAQELIDKIKNHGRDYSKYNKEIAEKIDKYVFNGNWDVSFNFNDMTGFRLIQEDEYDQHMDDGDEDGYPRPDYDFYLDGHYVILE